MDDFVRKLKRDAENIPAEITPELEGRLRGSLAAQAPPRAGRSKPNPRRRLWLAAALSGAAAALVTIALLPSEPHRQPEAVAEALPVTAVPGYDATFDRALPLAVEPADLTAPLEEELENLRADLEQARRRVADDMAF